MPQISVDAGRLQGLASTCCAFQTIIYPKGATGSHFNLWCLLRWDIAGFKTESRVGTALTNLYTQQTWINFKPTKKVSERITFILIIVSSCWHLKQVSKRGADISSNITPDPMYFEFMLSIKVTERVAENLKQRSMVNSCLSKSSFTRKSSPLAWTLSLCFASISTSCKRAIPILNTLPSPMPEAPVLFLRKRVLEELVATICHGCPGTPVVHM